MSDNSSKEVFPDACAESLVLHDHLGTREDGLEFVCFETLACIVRGELTKIAYDDARPTSPYPSCRD